MAKKQASQKQKKSRWIVLLVLAIIVLVVAARFGVFKLIQRGSEEIAAESVPENPGQAVPVQGFEHISTGSPHPPYNSKPPTSGWHYPTPMPWIGIYTDPIKDEYQLHNLEHGGVMMQYKPGFGEVKRLESLVRKLRKKAKYCKLILAPYPGLDKNIALTAWGYIDKFDEYDEARIIGFINAHIDRGPERVPCP